MWKLNIKPKKPNSPPEPRILTFSQMWTAYNMWKGGMTARDYQRMLEMVFPDEDLTKYLPEDLLRLSLLGMVANGMDKFDEFIKALYNG